MLKNSVKEVEATIENNKDSSIDISPVTEKANVSINL